MIKAIISDFSRTLLFPKDPEYNEGLNKLYKEVRNTPDFKFFDYFAWNDRLGNFYDSFANDYDIYIFTSDTIQEDPALKKHLGLTYKRIFTLKDFDNLTKDNPQCYSKLSEEIKLSPNEIVYIDDLKANVDAAAISGMNIIHYQNLDQCLTDFHKIVSL